MFKNLMNNLSQKQKIGILVLGQVLVIIILVLIVQTFTSGREYVKIENTADNNVPENVKEYVADNIWEIIKSKVGNVERNDIDDVVIREGTYEETEAEDGSVRASFIVDIDSLKQSYRIDAGWSKDKSVVYEVTVNCPPIDQMKYPETVCYGAYNNTYSLSLYLPYAVYPEGYDAENDEVMAPEIYITGDEDTKVIDVMISVCDVEALIKKADEYLDTLPIDLNNYMINYNINDVNVRC